MKHYDKFSVLIAEDEPIILNNIAKKVEKVSPDITVVGKAQSGMEALDLLKNTPADIVITDIEMPGMNGLELIRALKKDYPKIHIIVLSGYSNFEYARTALRYGVEDYLLKPVEQETLSELLLTLCSMIAEERRSSSREILSLALNESTDQAPPYTFGNEGLMLFHITLGNLLPETEGASFLSERMFPSLWSGLNFVRSFEQISDVEHLWLIDEQSSAQKFLILHIPRTRMSADYFCLLLKQELSRSLGTVPFLVLTCKETISYHQLWQKARILRSAAKILNRPFRQTYATVSDAEPPKAPETNRIRKDMQLLLTLSTETAYLQCIHRTLPEICQYPASVLHLYIREIFQGMHQCFQINLQDCDAASSAFFARIPSIKSEEECYTCLESSLRELWTQASSHATGSTLCSRIAQYIELHLTEPVSLTGLSERFGYTPSYINRIFKKEFGTSPLQYLTDLRMTRAKEILRKNSDINIKSVAMSVGFDDPRYFSRVFKNETGYTPSGWVEAEGATDD